jgi:hypothetical protein
MYVMGNPSGKATPVAALVPNPSPIGDNWLPGLWMVWAERNIDRSNEWVYSYADREGCFLHSGQGCGPSVYRTKREALRAGIDYIKRVYHADLVEMPGTFPAVPGPFRRAEA